MSWEWSWKPYVSAAERRQNAARLVSSLRKQGKRIEPVEIEGRKVARTFWGESWCSHLESFSDYANRLPRGRTYVRNGSVCHLEVRAGEINAIVSGSEIYNVSIKISRLADAKWKSIKKRCAGQVGSLIELLQGKLSGAVMAVVTDRSQGLFPLPSEIKLKCSCPDWAVMCKHVAAVLYGVGARLDHNPELLFLLRGVDHLELIATDTEAASSLTGNSMCGGSRRIAASDLESVFGIEMVEKGSQLTARSSSKSVMEKGSQLTARSSKPEKRKVAARGKTGAPGGALPAPRATRDPSSAGRREGRTKVAKPLTGKVVTDMRARFGMSVDELALLIGASSASVRKWEQQTGPLSCHSRTRDALNEASKLSKKEAWNRCSLVAN